MPTIPPLRSLRPRRWAAALLTICGCATFLPGCIAWEIRDELRTANYRISSLQTELEELQRTNQRLEVVRQQLLILERIQISLSNLDEHLAAVRVVISSMSSMMSLFDFSEDEPVDPNDPNAPGAAEQGAGDAAAGDAGEAGGTAPKESKGVRLRLKKPPAEPPAPPAQQPDQPEGQAPAPEPELLGHR